MSLKTDLNELQSLVSALAYDVNALLGGTKSGSVAARAKLLKASKLCGRMRKECLVVKGGIPIKRRGGKKDHEPIDPPPPQLKLQRENTIVPLVDGESDDDEPTPTPVRSPRKRGGRRRQQRG